jgi:hypothetical protein
LVTPSHTRSLITPKMLILVFSGVPKGIGVSTEKSDELLRRTASPTDGSVSMARLVGCTVPILVLGQARSWLLD